MRGCRFAGDLLIRRCFGIETERERAGRGVMKRKMRRTVYSLIGVALLLPGVGLANVCSEGVGIPPFLSSGAKPNLLMVLDNSGSMLDAAYSDKTSFCFDDTYDATKTYGGYFKKDRWYKWVGSGTDASYASLPPWESGHNYGVGDRVYANGIVWEALTTDQSTGDNFTDDIGVAWKKVTPENVNKWANGVGYTVDDIVWSGPQLYRATNTATSNDPDDTNGLNLVDDQSVVWEQVDSTWKNGKSYSTGDLVSYKGSLYAATGDGTSVGTGVYDDTGVAWNFLKEGSFVEVASGDASSYCSGASGSEKYTHADLCISLDPSTTPKQVSAFAARGNFLNWTMASKFDVEKKILTGGRYNYKDDLMMTEHRGCSGARAIKQVQMDGDPGKFLSLGIRGSRYNDDPKLEDRVDSTDDTGRLEILGITDSGYATSPECQAAIEKVTNHGLNGSQSEIQSCLESFPNSSSEMTDMRPALNHSLQVCWQDDPETPEFEINDGHFNLLVKHCTALFTGENIGSIDPSQSYHPSALLPKDGGPYICYGVYDSDIDHMNRSGYMGRVWVDGGGGGGVTMKTCNPRNAAGECSGVDCCWKAGPAADGNCLNYKNNSDGYVEQCTAISGGEVITCTPQNANGECSGVNCCWGDEVDYIQCTTYRNNADGHVEQCTATNGKNGNNAQQTRVCTDWTVLANWDDGSGSCNYPVDVPISNDANAVCTQWKILGSWDDGSGTCNYGVDQPIAIGGDGTASGDWESTPVNTPGNEVYEAIKDYCNDLIYPEVIDPSDVAGKTGTTGNVPGLLRDSEL
ncbi:MAG: hypothetical protein D3925_11370, partial [Candidatus Electrothrix sp. AR5]|nr:hypothetical protein [Candidatus Electrothrix sp. AR5]